MVKRSGLGRNLSALLGPTEKMNPSETAKSEHLNLPIQSLQPGKYQPRQDMDEVALSELAASIKNQGLLQPLVVRALHADRYEIIAGERRFRACQIAGFTEIPVVLKQVDDETAMAMALVENLQREDLNVMDEARAIQRLSTEFSLSHQQIAELLGKSRAAISNALRLLNLTTEVRLMLENGDLEMGHARCLLSLDEKQQLQTAEWVIAKNLSVRETEALVAKVKAGKLETLKPEKKINPAPLFRAQLQNLGTLLQTKVSLKPGKAGTGTLQIHYEDLNSLEKILASLASETEVA